MAKPKSARTRKPAARKAKPVARARATAKRAPAKQPVVPPPAGKTVARSRSDKATKLELPAPRAAKPAKPGTARRRSEKPTRLDRPGKLAPADKPLAAAVDEAGLGWIDAGKGYQITLDGTKLAARNDKGKRLSAVPKEIRDGDAADQLEALRDWLVEHDRECLATVEQWMLRSLAVPRAVLHAVWDDPAWRRPLENAVVVAVDAEGGHDAVRAGLFRGVDPKKGVGVVDLDGETAWLETERVAIPHPILIAELDAWRELVTQLGVNQGTAQLHRETYARPAASAAASTTTIDQFENGKFAMGMHVLGKARQLGYKVRGGFATCKVWDAGAVSEARYWIGADSPDSETYTGQLSWVDGRERGLKLAEVGPVAFSEGMRMASSIYAARVVDKSEGDA
jgi:hypothetical protein